MGGKLHYRRHLRRVMATRGMFAITDLVEPLALRGITLSSSQVYRLVVKRPERLSLRILMALLDILECRMDELIGPVADVRAYRPRKVVGADAPLGDLRPKRPGFLGLTGEHGRRGDHLGVDSFR